MDGKNFSNLYKQRHEIIDRPWLDNEIDDWLSSKNQRTMVLAAGPGFGKSVYSNLLVNRLLKQKKQLIIIPHFCNSNNDASCDTFRFIEYLSETLLETIPEYKQLLIAEFAKYGISIQGTATVEKASNSTISGVAINNLVVNERSALAAFDRFIRKPAEEIARCNNSYQILFVIDGLDESLTAGRKETIADILKPLLSTQDQLPEFIKIFLTFRKEEPRLKDFLNASNLGENNRLTNVEKDIVNYVSRLLNHNNNEALRKKIVKQCEGNFLIAHHLIASIEENPNADPIEVIDQTPKTLNSIYLQFFHREIQKNEAIWLEQHKPIIALIAVSLGNGLTRHQLQSILEIKSNTLDKSLLLFRQFLKAPSDNGPFMFFHKSFRDFLLYEDDPQIEAAEAHQQIAFNLIDEHAPNWMEDGAEYARENLCQHLLHAVSHPSRKQRREIINKGSIQLSSVEYIRTRVKEFGPAAYCKDMEQWLALKDINEIDENILNTIGIYSEMIRLSNHILCTSPDQFAAQAFARISPNKDSSKALLAAVEKSQESSWIQPLDTCSMIVGSPIINTFDARNSASTVIASAANKSILVTNDDGEIISFDLNSAQEIKTISIDDRWVRDSAVNLERTTAYLALDIPFSTNKESGIAAIDLITLDILWSKFFSPKDIDISLSPDSKYLLCTNESDLWVLEAKTGEIVTNRHSISGSNCTCILSDSETFVLSTHNQSFYKGSLFSADLIQLPWLKGKTHSVFAIDNMRAVIGLDNGVILLCDFLAEKTWQLDKLEDPVWDLSWDREKLVYAGGADSRIHCYDVVNKKELWNYTAHVMKIFSIDYNENGLFTASKDGFAKSWCLSDLAENPPKLKFDDKIIEILSVSADGSKVAYAENNNHITLLSINSDNSYDSITWKAHQGKIKALTFSSELEELISFADDSMFKIWNVNNSHELKEKYSLGQLKGDYSESAELEFTIDVKSKRALFWNVEQTRLLHYGEQKIIEEIPHNFSGSIKFIDGHPKIIAYDENAGLIIYNLEKEKVEHTLKKNHLPQDDSENARIRSFWKNTIDAIEIRGNQMLLAQNQVIELWDLEQITKISDCGSYVGHIKSLKFISSLNAFIQAGMEDREIRLSALDGSGMIARYISDGMWWSMDASRDCRLIAGCSDEGLVLLSFRGKNHQ